MTQSEMEKRVSGRTIVAAELHPCFIRLCLDDGSELEIEPEEAAANISLQETSYKQPSSEGEGLADGMSPTEPSPTDR